MKEEKATKFNLNKLNHQWRNIMREAKSKELKKDIEILSQTFERVVDRKDSVIKSLAKDLEEAEEQYAMALRHHLQNVDYLIGMNKLSFQCAKIIRDLFCSTSFFKRMKGTKFWMQNQVCLCFSRFER